MKYLNLSGLEYFWNSKIKPIGDSASEAAETANAAVEAANEIAESFGEGAADVRLYNDAEIGYTLRQSRYWIMGKLCIVQFNFMFDGTVPSPAINVRLDNLPVLPAADNTPAYHNPISLGALKSGYGRSPQAGVARQYNTFFNIMASSDTSRYLQQVTTDWITNETTISGSIIYEI